MSDTPVLTTLGLFIIDENQYPKSRNREPEYDIIGGGASYAIIGGRIAAGPDFGRRVCGILDKGSDFSPQIETEIETWGSGAIFRSTPNRLTSRGANVYDENGIRTFIYRAPKKRIEGSDILETGNLIDLRSFHFCCSVERCEETIDLFLDKTKDNGKPPAKFIFEPFPEVCKPENLEALNKILHKVDVFSPNLDEAAAFYGLKKLPRTEEEIAELALKFFKFSSANGGVVLRCGALGSYILSRTVSVMLPAYHNDQKCVIDVTGGGNSFCGGFITALVISNDWLTAGILGNIVSGCVIETLGMPKFNNGKWNGLSVKDRLQRYVNANREILQDNKMPVIEWIDE